MTGRFKNKPVKVKEFGTDEKGQPTVNGRPILKFRIKKLMPGYQDDTDIKEIVKRNISNSINKRKK